MRKVIRRSMGAFKILSSYPDQNEIKISHERELRDILNKMASNDPTIVLLTSNGSGMLTIGIDHTIGFIEFMKEDGTPPYLVALRDSVAIEDNSQFVNFDSGGTLTPISKNRCIPFKDVLEIASF